MADDYFNVPEGTDLIEVRKKISQLKHEIEMDSKVSRCLLCGKKVTSFANSHSVPQMVLRNITSNGQLYWMNSFIGYEPIELEQGVNKAGTFRCICRDCDSRYFQDYENEQNLVTYPSTKMLAEIAVKDYSQMISKRRFEKVLFEKLNEKTDGRFQVTNEVKNVQNLDMRDYISDLQISKKEITKNRINAYRLLYWKKLDYVIPIAGQTTVALHYDLDGKILNDIYGAPDKIRIQSMHIFAFPLKNESVVGAFYHNRDKIYNRLIHQFQDLSDDEKLSWLHYWLIANCENYFLSGCISSDVLNNEKMKLLSEEYDQRQNLGMMSEFEYIFGRNAYVPVKHTEIPNLLSEEYKIR